MKRIRRNVQLTQDEYDALRKYAKEKSVSFSQCLVNAALVERSRWMLLGMRQVGTKKNDFGVELRKGKLSEK